MMERAGAKFWKVAAVAAFTAAMTWYSSGTLRAFQPFVSSTAGCACNWDVAHLPNQTISWQLTPATPAMVGQSMNAAFKTWSDATGGAFKFEQNSASSPAAITVDWDTDGSKISDPTFLAYTSFNTDSTGHIVNAYMTVNAHNFTWHQGGFGGVGPLGANGLHDANLDSVILHELGHALGLDHSDRNPATIVGPVLPGDPPTMNSVIFPNSGMLHNDDIAGIRALYHADETTSASPLVVTADPMMGRPPLKVRFTQSGGDAATAWDFGDGVTAAGVGVQHRFTTKGTYMVRVGANGHDTTVTIQVGNFKKPKAEKKRRSSPRQL